MRKISLNVPCLYLSVPNVIVVPFAFVGGPPYEAQQAMIPYLISQFLKLWVSLILNCHLLNHLLSPLWRFSVTFIVKRQEAFHLHRVLL